MNIYVTNPDHGYGKKFVDLCKNIEVRKEATLQDFLDAGFTNANKRYLYFCRKINGPKGYNASFSITIRVKTKEIDDIDLLFEDFLQPKSCQKIDYEQSEKYIKMLVNKRVLRYGSKGEDR